VKIIEPEQNVNRLVEQLKEEDAQRRSRLQELTAPAQELAETHTPPFDPDQFLRVPRLDLEGPPPDRNKSTYALDELLAYDDREFLRRAYIAVLKRPPDKQGFTNALEDLRRAHIDKIDLLATLSGSAEGRQKGVRIPGLRMRALVRRLSRLPLIRYVTSPIHELIRLPSTVRDQQRVTGLVLARQELITDYLNRTILLSLHMLGSSLAAFSQSLKNQHRTQEVILERIAELTGQFEERINEGALHLQQEFVDRTGDIAELRDVYNQYRTQVELVEKDLKREMEHLFRKHQEVKTELVFQSQMLKGLNETRKPEPRVNAKPDQIDQSDGTSTAELDAFFASFDEHFRGKRDDVKKRLRIYLPLIRESGSGTASAPVLDIACGRGEWLELLKEEGLSAKGVDANRVLVSDCLEKGLEVTDADLNQYLRRLPDESMGAVTAFHIVEHLSIEKLIDFLDQTIRVLRKGGLVLIETPNPQNVLVGSCNFYLDPTHRNPLPMPALRFILESRGLIIEKTIDLNPSDEKPLDGHSELVQRFNDYFYGPMDYAMVARKV